MTPEKIIEASMDQFLEGDIDFGDIIEDQIILLLVHCPNVDAWYRVDALAGTDSDTPPTLQFFGPCKSRKQALVNGARAGH